MALFDNETSNVSSKTAAPSLRVQTATNLLDMTRTLNQLDKLIASPIRIPGTSTLPYPGSPNKTRHSVFSIKTIWPSDIERRMETSKLYNFKNRQGRKLLEKTLLTESDSESGGETTFGMHEIRILMKMHRRRRKIQKCYPTDYTNSQYAYIGTGVFSVYDRFPEHQASILKQKRFPNTANVSNVVRLIHENVKNQSNKMDVRPQ